MSRLLPLVLACVILVMMLNWAANAPEHLPGVDDQNAFAVPFELPPFGADRRGRPLIDYATQGAAVVVWPACFAGLLTAFFATIGGILRAIEWSWLDAMVQAMGEILGALPRMVVVLIIALMMDREQAQLCPPIAWAILSAPVR